MAAKHPEHPAVPAVEFLDASVFPAANDPVAGLVEYQCRCGDPERVRLGLLRPEVDGQGPGVVGPRIPVGVVHQHMAADGTEHRGMDLYGGRGAGHTAHVGQVREAQAAIAEAQQVAALSIDRDAGHARMPDPCRVW